MRDNGKKPEAKKPSDVCGGCGKVRGPEATKPGWCASCWNPAWK